MLADVPAWVTDGGALAAAFVAGAAGLGYLVKGFRGAVRLVLDEHLTPLRAGFDELRSENTSQHAKTATATAGLTIEVGIVRSSVGELANNVHNLRGDVAHAGKRITEVEDELAAHMANQNVHGLPRIPP